MKALLGRKLGMTQLFDENGSLQRVTIVEAGPCVVTQIKTVDKDGYEAIQIGFGRAKQPAKPQAGHATHKDMTPMRLREVRLDRKISNLGENVSELKVGDEINVNQFEAGDKVEVIGTSKGKGFAGTIKRHNFNTGPKSHGSHNYRAPGSIGSGYPEHVFKGMRMAGQMGGDLTTVKGLKVVQVDEASNVLAIKGAVPGPKKGLVMIRGAK